MSGFSYFKFLPIFALLFIVESNSLRAQETNLFCGSTNVGPILQVVTNQGHMGGAGLTNCPGVIHSEYPAGSRITYGSFSVWIAGKRNGETLVSTGGPWADHLGNRHELFPTAEPSDVVWSVGRGETVDIPYWPGYTGISDQDLVCRYNDYTVRTVQDHTPLYVDIIQVTYAWTSLEFLVHQYWIIPQRDDLQDVYFGYMGNMGIGRQGASSYAANDEFGSYDAENYMGIIEDLPEGDDTPEGPIGFRMFPDVSEGSITWTWHDGSSSNWNIQEPPSEDVLRYDYMKAGVQHDILQDRKYGHFLYSCGPFQVAVGDTLHMTMGQILGVGFDGMYENLDRLEWLRGQDYHFPAPPPRPPLRSTVINHGVTLSWDARPGEIDPETYEDQFRADNEPEPFEGYRVYKSTQRASGPWTLLAEYDRSDDDIGLNTGLEHSFTDVGLLNNLEYYYTVTGLSKPDTVLGLPSQESSLFANSILVIPGTASPETVGQVAVVPNPYRGDIKYYDYNPAWEKPSFGEIWVEQDRRIQFINLPNPCEIKIYTASGKYVNTLYHDDPQRGFQDWNLTSHVGQTIASGVYLFTVEDVMNGKVQVGKFVVIK